MPWHGGPGPQEAWQLWLLPMTGGLCSKDMKGQGDQLYGGTPWNPAPLALLVPSLMSGEAAEQGGPVLPP
jgi:hypothetical protein